VRRWCGCVLSVAVLLVCGGSATARAQAVDIGAHVTTLDLGILNESAWGVGGRLGYETGGLVTIEGEVNVFQEQPVTGRRVQALGGLKLGGRTNAYGLFAKLRPGVLHFSRDFIMPGTACIAVVPTPVECLATRTHLALDFGSAIELYPSARSLVRVDIGTTYVWFGSRGEHPTRRTGNFQLSLGGGLRF
jgi:hypothetical protein